MKRFNVAFFIKIWIITVCIIGFLPPVKIFAWGDNYIDPDTGEKGRSSYTIEEINNGAIGATPISDGGDYKNSDNYPGQVIFNTVSDSTIGDEKNFVGARQTDLLEDGRAEGATPDTKWYGNNIAVTDGAFFVLRLYVHNNNPNGEDAVAENTRVKFSIPSGTSTVNEETGKHQIQVNGFINSSNATPSSYWDYINFNGDIPFHLDYVYGSALLNNNKTQAEAAAGGYLDNAGWALSDDIIKAENTDGVLIGSDALDGRVPGGYEYANYVTIMVRAVFDYEYTVEQKVRLAESNDDWEDVIEAKVGDKVDFRIEYKNTSDKQQDHVAIKDILPSNLKYVDGTSVIKNSSYPKDATFDHDYLVTTGTKIGSYGPGANALVYFTAEVVDEDLKVGVNTLTNWSQAGVGQKTIQDHASVIVYKNAAWFPVVITILLCLIVLCLAAIVGLLFYKWRIRQKP